MPPSDEQRGFFEKRGWFHLGPVFSPDDLDEIRAEYDRILSRPLRLQEEGRTPFEYSPLLHVQSETLCRHACSRRLTHAA